jgi:hypothetical protein
MISFDIETCGVESCAVILSVGCVKFDLDLKEREPDPNNAFQSLLNSSFFVALDVREQRAKGRTIEPDTMDWWKQQAEIPRKKSLNVPTRTPVLDGLNGIAEYCKGETVIWQRGTLDQVLYDSLCKQYGISPIVNFNQWMDFRTAIYLLKDTARNGYCKVPGFDTYQVVKHDPVHDAALDVIQLVYGE